eukprot:scaffold117865_cov26-Tisochrysis_lutea.AAC.3
MSPRSRTPTRSGAMVPHKVTTLCLPRYAGRASAAAMRREPTGHDRERWGGRTDVQPSRRAKRIDAAWS